MRNKLRYRALYNRDKGIVAHEIVIALITGRWKEEPIQSTQVVGEYKGCEIVQWQYSSLAEYKYFLYCNND